ncbi:hypothetical protein FISHEDRAFT_36832 [Fistulina hepatica ATCC 64428]|uniref:Uncharacterized protein n=1 Tax=Fistulina hepatica ATCC 64428 TaxID=1128425 RepID=A0A0D7AK24_9AGAR|nr:hypothetical protein FISHEDRAFT_36832 [Fistulina hepatica ATCC 64428]
MDTDGALSRSSTPETPMSSSLHRATVTIDDLTRALADYSRVSSPELPSSLPCCCGQDCVNVKAWQELKSRLERRLILSAEVGQALLQRQEAHARRHKVDVTITQDLTFETQIAQLTQEKDVLQKVRHIRDHAVWIVWHDSIFQQLDKALMNAELVEVANKSLSDEMDELRSNLSRLTTQHARSVGWESRLSTALRDRDDMQQERDSAYQRACLAESRFDALKEKMKRVQAEVRRLQDCLEDRRMVRMKSSNTLIQETKSRIRTLQQSVTRNLSLNQPTSQRFDEIMQVLESVVHDNDELKRDNGELQRFLADAREETHVLQEELEEQRANMMLRSRSGTPPNAYSGSLPTSNLRDLGMTIGRRSESMDRPRRSFEPLTPETIHTLISPESFSPTSIISPRPMSFETGRDTDAFDDERPRSRKTMLVLTKSRGIQTDFGSPLDALTAVSTLASVSSPSSHDPRSEASSFSDVPPSTPVGLIIERIAALFTRLTQADVLTLTNRLKRQKLKGDIGHLSRTTVANIIAETTELRNQFRMFLEDDRITTSCTRKDLRALFKVFKDVFNEIGSMRVVLNDVILDPSVAARVSEFSLNPAKADQEREQTQRSRESTQSGPTGWVARLFGTPGRGPPEPWSPERPGPSLRHGVGSVRAPKFVPKQRAATSASATTVEVEFSGTGAGRNITNSSAPVPSSVPMLPDSPVLPSHLQLFAGAPQPQEQWIILPKKSVHNLRPRPRTSQQRQLPTKKSFRLSRNVDAVIDHPNDPPDMAQMDDGETEGADTLGPLVERRLKRRGLSDSSMHSTFSNHAQRIEEDHDDNDDDDVNASGGGNAAHVWDGSMFQAITKRVQSLRLGVQQAEPAPVDEPASTTAAVDTSRLLSPGRNSSRSRADQISSSPSRFATLLPAFTAWTEAMDGSEARHAGSVPRDNTPFFSGVYGEDLRGRY